LNNSRYDGLLRGCDETETNDESRVQLLYIGIVTVYRFRIFCRVANLLIQLLDHRSIVTIFLTATLPSTSVSHGAPFCSTMTPLHLIVGLVYFNRTARAWLPPSSTTSAFGTASALQAVRRGLPDVDSLQGKTVHYRSIHRLTEDSDVTNPRALEIEEHLIPAT
jgi:hypothetical protein